MSEVKKNPKLGLLDKIAIFSIFLLLSSLSLYIYSPVFNSNAGTAVDGTEAYRASIQTDDEVDIPITPSSTQEVYSAKNTISYTNTCPAGFYLYLSSETDDTSLWHQSEFLSIETTSSDTELTDNSWGYSIDNETTYHPIPTPSNMTPILDVTSINETANNFDVYFGVKTDNSIKSGAYLGNIIYTLTAKESCYGYEVIWDANSGINPDDLPDTINLDGTINLSALPRPTRAYYNFSGWTNGDDTFTGDETAADINPNNDPSILMMALWEPTPFSLTYNLDGGEADNPASYNIESSTITLKRPTKAGSRFLGWSGTGIDGLATTVTIPTGSHDNRSFTAHWEEACSFTTQDFSYTGEIQTLPIEEGCGGIYKLEVWGAQGGSAIPLGSSIAGGKGGYATGNIALPDNIDLFIGVGGAGSATNGQYTSRAGGFNGGGSASCSTPTGLYKGGGSGGGATHIALEDGTLASMADGSNVLIVAGGGAGGYGTTSYNNGNEGIDNRTYGAVGGPSVSPVGTTMAPSGGGYGSWGRAGAGGGYVGGSGNAGGTNYFAESLLETSAATGGQSMPKHDGTTGNMTGNSGNGFARITYIGAVYSVIFDANGGSVDTDYKALSLDDNVMGEMPIPTKQGEKFWGWYAESTFENLVTPTTVIKENMHLYARWSGSSSREFEYHGYVEGVRIPTTGTYKIEVWGASGGNAIPIGQSFPGGKGGYVSGKVSFNEGDFVYVGVGGAGAATNGAHQSEPGGFNGGGAASCTTPLGLYKGGGSGGGATHVAKNIGGLLSSITDSSKVLLVAGGGAGAYATTVYNNNNEDVDGYTNGGHGGITLSPVGTTMSPNGGTYGSWGYAGYGGGYVGGNGGTNYISIDITDGLSVAGNASMPTHDGTSTMTGNSGNGYAKFTFVE